MSYPQLVAALSERWRSLEGDGIPSIVLDRLHSHAPALQHLRLATEDEECHVELGEGLHLHSLDLVNVTLPWDSSRLVNLRRLSMSYIDGSHAPSLPQLSRLISLSPRSEYLTMEQLELNTSSDDEPLSTEKFHLPNLVSLDLDKISSEAYDHILSRIQFPLTSRMKLYLRPSLPPITGPGKSFDYLGADFVQQIRSIARNSGIPDLGFHHRTVHLNIRHSATNELAHWLTLILEAGTEDGWYDGIIRQMEQIIAKALPDRPLTLRLTGYMSLDVRINLLGMFPSTRKIILDDYLQPQVHQPFLQYLGQRHANASSGVKEWPCPHLGGVGPSSLDRAHRRGDTDLIEGTMGEVGGAGGWMWEDNCTRGPGAYHHAELGVGQSRDLEAYAGCCRNAAIIEGKSQAAYDNIEVGQEEC